MLVTPVPANTAKLSVVARGTGSSAEAALAVDPDFARDFDVFLEPDLAQWPVARRAPCEEHERAWCRGVAAASPLIAPASEATTTRQAAGFAAERLAPVR
jgi:hypothetical protein